MQVNFVGVDIDSKWLVAKISRRGTVQPITQFANNPVGYRKFIAWATRRGQPARVCCESTGVYSQAFALELHRAPNLEVMIVNPKAIHQFAQATLARGKTDAMDAEVILEYLTRMSFKAWCPPSDEVLEIQALSRRLVQLSVERTRERNRLHAANRRGALGRAIAHDITLNLRHLERRIDTLRAEALALIQAVPELQHCYEHLVSATGIGVATAIKLIGELMALPPDMQAPQWVAHAGLDPRPRESGSMNKPRRVSKAGNRYIREALYMPALVAIKHDPHVKAFYDKLVAAGKKPMQAIIAVMRKLLLAIWGMLKNDENWNGAKFYRLPQNA
jgi:transposase